MPTRNPEALELRAVAPIIVAGASPTLVGAALLVTNGTRVVGVTSAELLRPFLGQPLAIVTKLDGSAAVPIASWGMGRYSGLALVELGGDLVGATDLEPLPIGAVRATPDTRGSPAGVVAIVANEPGYRRQLIPVHVDLDDGGGMSDTTLRLVSPLDATHVALAVEGAPLFVWFPADPALGRPSEVLAVASVQPYRARTAQPRDLPVLGELVGFDDLGRALIDPAEPDDARERVQVAGEIET